MRVLVLALSAAMLLAAPALAQTDPVAPPAATEGDATSTPPTPQSAPQPETTEQSADQEVICRTVQRTESRLRSRRERICGTRAEWEIMQQEAAQQIQRTGSVNTAPRN